MDPKQTYLGSRLARRLLDASATMTADELAAQTLTVKFTYEAVFVEFVELSSPGRPSGRYAFGRVIEPSMMRQNMVTLYGISQDAVWDVLSRRHAGLFGIEFGPPEPPKRDAPARLSEYEIRARQLAGRKLGAARRAEREPDAEARVRAMFAAALADTRLKPPGPVRWRVIVHSASPCVKTRHKTAKINPGRTVLFNRLVHHWTDKKLPMLLPSGWIAAELTRNEIKRCMLRDYPIEIGDLVVWKAPVAPPATVTSVVKDPG